MHIHTLCHRDVKIRYCDSRNDHGTIPLIIIPGMINHAEEYIDSFSPLFEQRRCIFITLRGRKGSEYDGEFFTFNDHISDIKAVTESLSLTCFHIFGHSVGAAYSLGFTEFSQYHRRIILGDYPAYYPQFSSQWSERICTYGSQHMTCSTARKIAEQSTHINLFPLLKQALMPPVLLYSTQSDSLIKQHHIDMFLQYREDTLCYPVHSVGHALFSLSSSECINRISSLLSNDDRKIIKQDNK